MLRPLAMTAVLILLVLIPAVVPGQVARFNSSKLDYTAFAVAAAPRLTEIEKEFDVRRKRAYNITRKEAEDLLGWAEKEVFAVLARQELASLRDSLQFRFRLHRDLAISSPTESLKAAAEDLRTLSTRATKGRFSLRLCVISWPGSGDDFRMRSPGYPQKVLGGPTIYLEEIAYGRYFYKIDERKGKRTIQCGWVSGGDDAPCLDLWARSGDQLFDCNFNEGRCKLRDLRSGECRGS